jgi:putative ABC transport system substrate-binding protein
VKRREFILLLGSAVAWSAKAHSQAPVSTVGFLSSRSPEESQHLVAAFLKGLGQKGFVEGKNLVIEYRWAQGRYDQLPALAAELINRPVSVIFTAGGPPSALVAKAATSTIPIVFSAANDPVRLGLVASLARPGGNVTGMSTLTTGLAMKGLQFVTELVPKATVFAFLMNPSNPAAALVTQEAREAEQQLGVKVELLSAATESELEASFATLKGLNAGGVVVYADPFFDSQRDLIVALSARYAVPAIYAWRDYVTSGGLMSYGSSLAGSYERVAAYVGRILGGEKPADLPVQQPAVFELVINLKTAKALDLTVPPLLLAEANEVIE